VSIISILFNKVHYTSFTALQIEAESINTRSLSMVDRLILSQMDKVEEDLPFTDFVYKGHYYGTAEELFNALCAEYGRLYSIPSDTTMDYISRRLTLHNADCRIIAGRVVSEDLPL